MGSGWGPSASWHDGDSLLILASCAGLALVGALLSRAGPTLPRRADRVAIATVTHATGGVLRRPTGSLAWDETGAGEPLAALDALYVPAGGSASVAFEAGAALDLDERSLIVVEPAADEEAAAPAVRLVRGSMEAGAGSAAPHIRGAAGEVVLEPGARGRFQARAEADGSWVQLRRGEARVDGARMKAPAHPVALEAPAAGARLYLPSFPALVPLRWQGDGAQLQLSGDASFANVAVFAAEAGASSVQAALPAPGVYHWRVAASDGRALSETRRLVALEDRAPDLYAPSPGELVYAPQGTEVMFWWTEVEAATRYRLEIAADASFTRVVLARDVEGPTAWIEPALPEGVYHWRVRAMGDAHPAAPGSAPGTFRLIHAAVPGAPELLDPTLEVGDGPR